MMVWWSFFFNLKVYLVYLKGRVTDRKGDTHTQIWSERNRAIFHSQFHVLLPTWPHSWQGTTRRQGLLPGMIQGAGAKHLGHSPLLLWEQKWSNWGLNKHHCRWLPLLQCHPGLMALNQVLQWHFPFRKPRSAGLSCCSSAVLQYLLHSELLQVPFHLPCSL